MRWSGVRRDRYVASGHAAMPRAYRHALMRMTSRLSNTKCPPLSPLVTSGRCRSMGSAADAVSLITAGFSRFISIDMRDVVDVIYHG